MLQTASFFKQRRRRVLLLVAAGLYWCMSVVRSQDTTDIGKHFKSFLEFWGKLKMGLGDDSEISAGGQYPYTSSPVPVRRKGQVQIAYMVCRKIVDLPRHQDFIWPPNLIEWFDPVSGMRAAEATAVSPEYFGQKDPVDKPLVEGRANRPPMSFSEFEKLQNRLFELYDLLFPVWATDSTAMGQILLQNLAREFLNIFNQISIPKFRPYYESLGHDWFGWLRKLANE